MQQKTLLAAAIAAASLFGAGVAQAVPAVVAPSYPAHVVQLAPPAPIYEAVPAPRSGYVWAPGHYEFRDGRYVWNQGRWLESRAGWAWQEARWQQRPDGSWFLVGGQWVRTDNLARYDEDDRNDFRRGPNGDLDGDGVRNADDRDRDGDGVSNRDDDFPNNANRS